MRVIFQVFLILYWTQKLHTKHLKNVNLTLKRAFFQQTLEVEKAD